jgi:hypothetical protein
MGSVMITDPVAPSGVVEARLISRLDDHSRYSVIAKVAPRATARAVYREYLCSSLAPLDSLNIRSVSRAASLGVHTIPD